MAKEAWLTTPVPGATVGVVNGPSSGVTVSDDQGRYRLSNLLPGAYTIRFLKPPPFGANSYNVTVMSDTTFDGSVSLSAIFPLSPANLQGYWIMQGPYPNEPARIMVIQNGTQLQGWYRDKQDYSTVMSGTLTNNEIFLNVGVSGLTIEGRVRDATCIRGVIKNEALGGNFPVVISRGSPGVCVL